MKRTMMLSVQVEKATQIPTIAEVLSRAMAGLLMEGIEGSIYSYEDEGDDAQG